MVLKMGLQKLFWYTAFALCLNGTSLTMSVWFSSSVVTGGVVVAVRVSSVVRVTQLPHEMGVV